MLSLVHDGHLGIPQNLEVDTLRHVENILWKISRKHPSYDQIVLNEMIITYKRDINGSSTELQLGALFKTLLKVHSYPEYCHIVLY